MSKSAQDATPAAPGFARRRPPSVVRPWLSYRELRRRPLDYFCEATREHGDVVRMGIEPWPVTLVRHPDAVSHVLVEHVRNYDKQTRGFDALRMFLGNGLLTSEGDFWRRQRRIAQPAFHRQRIAGFATAIVELTDAMLGRWDRKPSGETIDIADEMTSLTLRIVTRTLFSSEVEDQGHGIGHGIGRLSAFARAYMTNPLSLGLQWPTPRNREFKRTASAIDQVVLGLIARRRDEGHREDLLSMLMDSRDAETGASMSDQQLRDEVMTIFAAGHETTANALSWTFYMLSKHPLVLRRLLDELARVLGGRPPALSDIAELPYLQQVVKESMRLYPPVWAIGRRARSDDEIRGYRIEAGTLVVTSPWVSHRDPRYWPNPEGFDPDRFTEAAERGRPRYAYFPFGGGPRLCIGNNFALLEAHLVLAAVLQRHVPVLCSGARVEPEPLITLRPKGGLPMVLESPSRFAA